jgi:hypothetical protein
MRMACRGRSNRAAIRWRMSRKFSAKNQRLPPLSFVSDPASCNPLQKIGDGFSDDAWLQNLFMSLLCYAAASFCAIHCI